MFKTANHLNWVYMMKALSLMRRKILDLDFRKNIALTDLKFLYIDIENIIVILQTIYRN